MCPYLNEILVISIGSYPRKTRKYKKSPIPHDFKEINIFAASRPHAREQ
jgi:hypothetical protein